MNPVGRVLRILLVSVHADSQHYLFTFIGTCFNGILERDRFSPTAIKYRCFISQGFQLSLDAVNVVRHFKKIRLQVWVGRES